MSTSLASKKTLLVERASMLAKVRSFFAKRGVTEVDTPLLSETAPTDPYIEVMEVDGIHYLHTSPEFAMKRLLADGAGDIYQLSHVFRGSEKGRLHYPEFTMIEWYRHNFTFSDLIEETLALLFCFVGKKKWEQYTFREACQKFLGFDYLAVSTQTLLEKLPEGMHDCEKSEMLIYLFSEEAEKKFNPNAFTVITDFPASEAALSKIRLKGDEQVCSRFEIYYKGVELANGYDELIDPDEQQERFEKENAERAALGKKVLPIDYKLIEALRKGMPECMGVAVGFDRALMLRQGAKNIEEILPLTTL